jgi:hypothetical protein
MRNSKTPTNLYIQDHMIETKLSIKSGMKLDSVIFKHQMNLQQLHKYR